jgi:hypothetical protein
VLLANAKYMRKTRNIDICDDSVMTSLGAGQDDQAAVKGFAIPALPIRRKLRGPLDRLPNRVDSAVLHHSAIIRPFQ